MSDDHIFTKCAWRLIPFMMLLYLVNIIDRVNVGFAALTMNKDLAFSPAIYGLGAGIFFIGYCLFQVPANLILERVGARRWIFGIMATWGSISAANAFVQGPNSFYALRFFLGVAEAGLFPGMLLYLTYWFPQGHRARFTAIFMVALPLSVVVGGPLSGVILGMDGIAGLRGWQWLFLIEGLPAVPLAFAVLKFLPDGPAHASWLTGEERKRIAARVAVEDVPGRGDLGRALRDPRVAVLGLVNLSIQFGVLGAVLWLPQVVQAMGYSNSTTGFLLALPFAAGMGAMVVWGHSSDMRGERIWHIALPALLAALGFAAASLLQANVLVLLALSVALVGLFAVLGPFFSLPSSFLRGTAAAGGIALFNTIGSLGGFLGPTVLGFLRQESGGYAAGMMALAVGLMTTAVIVLAIARAIAAPGEMQRSGAWISRAG